MKKWILEQIIYLFIIILVTIPAGLVNTILEMWKYEH